VDAAAPTSRAITCSRCGGALTLRAERAETAVCPYCHAQLDLTGSGYAFLEQLRRRPDDTALSVGLAGRLEGVDYVVAGFVRWSDPDAESSCLDDWFLQGPAGRTGWLRFDGYAWQLCHVLRPTDADPVDLQTLDPESQWVNCDGAHHLVLERSRGTITYLEGELLWKARVGEAVMRLHCDPDVSVEVGPTRVRYFRWQHVAWQNVAEAFGVPDEAARPAPFELPKAAPAPKPPAADEEPGGYWIWILLPALALAAIAWGLVLLRDYVDSAGDAAPAQVELQRPPHAHALQRP